MTLSLWLVVVCGVIGIVDTVYLSYHAISKTPVTCWWFPVEWCRTVQYSTYSRTFGIPNPFAGLVMYIAILVLAVLYLQGAAVFGWLKVIVTIGFLFSVYFTFIQAAILRAFCTWCVVSALNFTIMFVVVYFLR